jgi:hypothetical protein
MRFILPLPLLLLGLTACVVSTPAPAPVATTYVTPAPTTYVAPAPTTTYVTPVAPPTTTVIRTP